MNEEFTKIGGPLHGPMEHKLADARRIIEDLLPIVEMQVPLREPEVIAQKIRLKNIKNFLKWFKEKGERIITLDEEVRRYQDTNRRLNRRCQKAEASLKKSKSFLNGFSDGFDSAKKLYLKKCNQELEEYREASLKDKELI